MSFIRHSFAGSECLLLLFKFFSNIYNITLLQVYTVFILKREVAMVMRIYTLSVFLFETTKCYFLLRIH